VIVIAVDHELSIQGTLDADSRLIEHMSVARKSFATRFQLSGFSDK
jgi:hypothetical protein